MVRQNNAAVFMEDDIESAEAANKISEEDVQGIRDEIANYGNFNEWFQHTVEPIYHGGTTDIVKKILCCLGTFQGRSSQFILTESRPGIGKSYADDILLKYVFPEEHILYANEMSKSSLSKIGSEELNRKLVFIGDVGDKSKIYRDNTEYEIFKHLVTENKFTRYLSKKDEDQNWEPVEEKLEVDSMSLMMQAVTVDQPDKQYESRTELFIVEEPEVSNECYEYRDRITKHLNQKYGIGGSNETVEKLNELRLLIKYLTQEFELRKPVKFTEYLLDYYEVNLIRNNVQRGFERIVDQYDSWCQLNNWDIEDPSKIDGFMKLFYETSPDLAPAERQVFELLCRRVQEIDWNKTYLDKVDTIEQISHIEGGSSKLYRAYTYDKDPAYFFTEGNVRSYDGKSKVIKGLGENQVKIILQSLYEKGYLGKLPEKRIYGKNAYNIYYIEPR